MADLNGRVRAALPTLNVVGMVATVAVLWWRAAMLEERVQGLTTAVTALQVEVAQLTQQLNDRPAWPPRARRE